MDILALKNAIFQINLTLLCQKSSLEYTLTMSNIDKLQELRKGLVLLSKDREVVLSFHETFEMVDELLEIVDELIDQENS